MNNKLKLLSIIGNELNKNEITWAVGASCMLYLNQIVNEFHDLDIMIDENDIEKAIEVFSKLGKLQEKFENNQYKTKYFLEYIIDDIEVDVMAGFIIVKDGIDYEAHFDKNHIEKYVLVNGVSIPLQYKSDWKKYYSLMNREYKANLCK